MKQIFYNNTENIFERACELREFGERGDLSWREWYKYEASRTGMKSGELETAIAETLNIPAPARQGIVVSGIDHETFIITDLEENVNCDLTDADDAYLIAPVNAFREWLHAHNQNPLHQVMGTDEAAALWGYDSSDSIKRLCADGKLEARIIGKTWILKRNQKSPRQK
jgi:hypothetical protein